MFLTEYSSEAGEEEEDFTRRLRNWGRVVFEPTNEVTVEPV